MSITSRYEFTEYFKHVRFITMAFGQPQPIVHHVHVLLPQKPLLWQITMSGKGPEEERIK